MRKYRDYQLSYYQANKERILARNERWRQDNKAKDISDKRKSHLKRAYGMTVEEYDDLNNLQDGNCIICASPCKVWDKLVVDHCHATGNIRGLLCHNCNVGLGKFLDNPVLLERAAQYLRNFQH